MTNTSEGKTEENKKCHSLEGRMIQFRLLVDSFLTQ